MSQHWRYQPPLPKKPVRTTADYFFLAGVASFAALGLVVGYLWLVGLI